LIMLPRYRLMPVCGNRLLPSGNRNWRNSADYVRR